MQKLGRAFVLDTSGARKGFTDKDALRRTIVKFKESSWKLCYFLSAEILALYISHNEPYFTDSGKFWVGPGSQQWPDQKVK